MADGATDKIPKPGDTVIFKRSDGLYDVRKVDASGQTEVVRLDLPSLDKATHLARANVARRGRIWVEDHAKPNVFERL